MCSSNLLRLKPNAPRWVMRALSEDSEGVCWAARGGSAAPVGGSKLRVPNLLPQQSEGLRDGVNQVLALPLKVQSKFPLLDPAVLAYEFFR